MCIIALFATFWGHWTLDMRHMPGQHPKGFLCSLFRNIMTGTIIVFVGIDIGTDSKQSVRRRHILPIT